MKNFNKDRSGKTGTNEWAEIKYNIQKGCSNNCIYCYGCANALQYGRIGHRDEWKHERVNYKKVSKNWRKRKGVIMFPTTHDINDGNLTAVIVTLNNMLEAGNEVLLVSKPRLDCIKEIINSLNINYKDKILFRFTITSLIKDVSKFWEPEAPLPEERVECLKYAWNNGYNTSVSCEPLLGGLYTAILIYNSVKNFISNDIWFGKMNRIRQRIKLDDALTKEAVENIEVLQSDTEMKRLYELYKDDPKVKWKDSIRKVVGI